MGELLAYGFLSIPLIGAYAIFALGISLIYRASRVLNLAHGAMAMIPAYIFYTLVVRAKLPMSVALLLSILSGVALGIWVERLFVRRLRRQGPTAQTVGTVAVTGLLVALAAQVWGTTPLLAPQVFPEGSVSVGQAVVRYGELGLLATAIAVSAVLFSFFRFTQVGLAMRGAAQNRRAAALMGIDPNLAAATAWGMGGGLAALAGVMLASVTNLDPYTLSLQVLPGFVAALIGGLASLPGAFFGAVVAGLAFGLVPAMANLPVIGQVLSFSGAPQLVLTLLAVVVMAVRGRRIVGVDETGSGLSVSTGSFGRRTKRAWPAFLLIGAGAVAWPFIASFSLLGTSVNAIIFALAAVSVVVLTGWVGQISLAQASFVGIAALVTGVVARSFELPFPGSLVVSAAVAAGAAALLGVVALRVRGLYLAVATLIFAWMADQFLFRTPWLGAHTGTSTIGDQRLGTPGALFSFDLHNEKILYFVGLAVLVIAIFSLANLRDTKTGRAFFAVRGSEMAAASLGIDVTRYKLAAFALAGGVAGIAGNLLMIKQRSVVPTDFLFSVSLLYLGMAVVGGLASLSGAVLAGLVFAGLSELFFQVPSLAGWLDVVSAGLLALVLLVYPGGLAAIPGGIRRVLTEKWHLFVRAARLLRPVEKLLAPVGDRVLSASVAIAAAGWKIIHAAAGAARPVLSGFGERIILLGRGRGRRAVVEVPGETQDWFTAAKETFSGGAPEGEASSGNGSGDSHRQLLRLGDFVPKRSKKARIRLATPALIEANDVIVRFGGLTAVNHATLEVREGEIVGLIGPNGAGKTTLFNAILGLNEPASGGIALYGHDAGSLPPHLRARMGVARTFQVLQMFAELTVFDNLLVATHLRNRSGLWSNLAASGKTLRSEREARDRVQKVISLLELEEVSLLPVRGLPFGILRMAELGRALVTGARLLMLDEPASGLNDAETDRLIQVIRGARELGVTVLLIEHDVRMVTSVCDYIYVLDQGQIIAEGRPQEIQRDPKVIAAYLGGAEETEREAVSAQ